MAVACLALVRQDHGSALSEQPLLAFGRQVERGRRVPAANVTLWSDSTTLHDLSNCIDRNP